MQAIDQKKHQTMTRIIAQYEEYFTYCGEMIPEDHDEAVRESIAEFKGSYDYYRILLKELEECIEQYKDLHGALQKIVYPYARKMSSELRRRKNR